jgi:hypothetical protein
MRRLFRPCVLILAAALMAGGCSESTAVTPTTPTAPAPTITETFTGTIGPNGAHTYPFSSGSGTVTLTLTSVRPDKTKPLGISIGTWSGTACTVGTGLFNDAATEGTTITGNVTAFGLLCVRIYDGAGLITAPTTYIVTVIHP